MNDLTQTLKIILEQCFILCIAECSLVKKTANCFLKCLILC